MRLIGGQMRPHVGRCLRSFTRNCTFLSSKSQLILPHIHRILTLHSWQNSGFGGWRSRDSGWKGGWEAGLWLLPTLPFDAVTPLSVVLIAPALHHWGSMRSTDDVELQVCLVICLAAMASFCISKLRTYTVYHLITHMSPMPPDLLPNPSPIPINISSIPSHFLFFLPPSLSLPLFTSFPLSSSLSPLPNPCGP